jgi:hypothetical protein
MRTAEERFWAKVKKTDTCWLWTAARFRGGYGQFRMDRKIVSAHRIAYALVKGPIPEGLHIDHICRVRHCVNPDHLEAVTKRVNTLRGISPIAIAARKTHCPQGHAYNDENTNLYQGRRYCRPCGIARSRAYHEAHRPARPNKLEGVAG